MTVPAIPPFNNWVGDNSSTEFDYDFMIENENQLTVFHTNSDNIQIKLRLNVDYSVLGVGNINGGKIKFPLSTSSFSVLTPDEVISLLLDLPIEQPSGFGSSDNLDLTVLEKTFDYVVRCIQIINRQQERTIKLQEGSAITPEQFVNDLFNVKDDTEAFAKDAAESADKAYQEAGRAESQANRAKYISDTFNENAQIKTNEFNQNALDKTNEQIIVFNINAEDKTISFNNNYTNKMNALALVDETAQNAASRADASAQEALTTLNDITQVIDGFDEHAELKKQLFDINAETETSLFNANVEAKTVLLQTYVDNAGFEAEKAETAKNEAVAAKEHIEATNIISVEVEDTETIQAGLDAEVVNIGTNQELKLLFKLPRGASAFTVELGDLYEIPDDETPRLVNRGTAEDQIWDLYIHRGMKGEQGEPGQKGEPGEPGAKGEPGEKGEPGQTYELPIASANTLGGFKVGENLYMEYDGTLRAITRMNDYNVQNIETVKPEYGDINLFYSSNISIYNVLPADWFTTDTLRIMFDPRGFPNYENKVITIEFLIDCRTHLYESINFVNTDWGEEGFYLPSENKRYLYVLRSFDNCDTWIGNFQREF